VVRRWVNSDMHNMVLVGVGDKGKEKRVVDFAVGGSLDGSKLAKMGDVCNNGVLGGSLGVLEDEGVGSGLRSPQVVSGSSGSSGSTMVAIGLIIVHAEDALTMIPSIFCSGPYIFSWLFNLLLLMKLSRHVLFLSI
jgi:hypothetical protein